MKGRSFFGIVAVRHGNQARRFQERRMKTRMRSVVLMFGAMVMAGGAVSSALASEIRVIDEAVIMSAACGPNVVGIAKIQNGIGEVTIAYRKWWRTLVHETHVIADPSLCVMVQNQYSLRPDGMTPFVVKLALESVLFGGKAVALELSERGVEKLESIDGTKGREIHDSVILRTTKEVHYDYRSYEVAQ